MLSPAVEEVGELLAVEVAVVGVVVVPVVVVLVVVAPVIAVAVVVVAVVVPVPVVVAPVVAVAAVVLSVVVVAVVTVPVVVVPVVVVAAVGEVLLPPLGATVCVVAVDGESSVITTVALVIGVTKKLYRFSWAVIVMTNSSFPSLELSLLVPNE